MAEKKFFKRSAKENFDLDSVGEDFTQQNTSNLQQFEFDYIPFPTKSPTDLSADWRLWSSAMRATKAVAWYTKFSTSDMAA